MKVVVQINSMKNGSTGYIMNRLAREGRKRGYTVYTSSAGNLYQRGLPTECPEYHIYIGGILENKLHKTLGSIFGGGCYSHLGTYLFLKKLDKIKPDLLHLHNLHSNFINLKMLFHYIRKKRIKVIWTLHDCWAFTGHCPYFDMAGCDKWKSYCKKCPEHKKYPESFFDDAEYMYFAKKRIFCGIKNMVLVTPSKWLANLTKQSFLKDYPVKVIHNGIALSVFRMQSSEFRKKYGIDKKQKILLGVSFSWGTRKGLDIFLKLASCLEPDQYRIVLVGTNDKIDSQLPPSIISIHYTESQAELAQIYSEADVFINPTREDNFPTVNMEALACGTPIITFNTGGSPEIIDDTCGITVEKEDIDGIIGAIQKICGTPDIEKKCIKKAEGFDIRKTEKEYFKLYDGIEKNTADSVRP